MLAICGIVLAESDGMMRVIAILLAAVVTAFAIYKLKLLDPVLKHYYNPRKSRRQRQEEEDAENMRRISRSSGVDYSALVQRDRMARSNRQADNRREQRRDDRNASRQTGSNRPRR